MKIAFTIVSRSYFSLAKTLSDSITKHNPDIKFIIVIADAQKNEIKDYHNSHVYSIYDIISFEINHYAFKYDVTEFCTFLKPYTFLFLKKKYEEVNHITYFDPDFIIYRNIDDLYKKMDLYGCGVTPHFLEYDLNKKGFVPDQVIMFAGVFNFGFVTFNFKKKSVLRAIEWWAEKLKFNCYADKIDAFHTDQKMGDFFPIIFKDELLIIDDPSMNIAIWNLHEREISKTEETGYRVKLSSSKTSFPLSFIHFAGYDPLNLDLVHKHFIDVESKNFPALRQLMTDYKRRLLKHDFHTQIMKPYVFDFFQDGSKVSKFHRRLYRSISEFQTNENDKTENPFSTNSTFYKMVKSKKMLNKSSIDKMKENTDKSFLSKLIKVQFLFKVFYSLIGFKNYSLLTKFLIRFLRPENQTFILHKKYRTFFYNENRNR